jgi:hypothetical protein
LIAIVVFSLSIFTRLAWPRSLIVTFLELEPELFRDQLVACSALS